MISRLLPLVLLAGCASDSHGPGTAHGETTDDHAGTAHTGGSPSTHAHASSTGAPDTTTDETGDAHATGADTTHAPTTAPETGTGGAAPSPAAAYCECMVVYCHDEYHGTWGEDHEVSVAMCEAEAAALPSLGMPATVGASIECRAHHCDLAQTDPAACASAIGGGSCT